MTVLTTLSVTPTALSRRSMLNGESACMEEGRRRGGCLQRARATSGHCAAGCVACDEYAAPTHSIAYPLPLASRCRRAVPSVEAVRSQDGYDADNETVCMGAAPNVMTPSRSGLAAGTAPASAGNAGINYVSDSEGAACDAAPSPATTVPDLVLLVSLLLSVAPARSTTSAARCQPRSSCSTGRAAAHAQTAILHALQA